jgi:predicted nucleic acid-binding protein
MKTARIYSRQVTWWITAVEAVGALNRLHREGNLTDETQRQALNRLSYLRKKWSEIQPTEEVRHTAERMLGIHKLRTADALQLSAALAWCKHQPRGRSFIAADGDLAAAAEKEGFTVIRIL